MSFSTGDEVTWNTPQGTTEGTVVEVKTDDFELEGNDFTASKDEPKYVVESAKSGKHAAHTGEALTAKGK